MEQKYKILLVEDEDILRDRYTEYLNSQGFEVRAAADGKEAVELTKTFDYHLMLLDIRLPKIDGLEVLKFVKSDPSLAREKVILLTVLGRDSIIKEGFELGADAYLIKDQETPETIKENILKLLEAK